MKVIQASQILVEWFSKRDSFNLETDFNSLPFNHNPETLQQDKASISAALEEFTTAGLTKRAIINNTLYYVLFRDMNSLSQSVQISEMTAKVIGDIIKRASEELNNHDFNFNPLQIEDKDILLAMSILTEVNNNKEPQPQQEAIKTKKSK